MYEPPVRTFVTKVWRTDMDLFAEFLDVDPLFLEYLLEKPHNSDDDLSSDEKGSTCQQDRESLYVDSLTNEDFHSLFGMTKAGFELLMEELSICPSFEKEFPFYGDNHVNANVIQPKLRMLVALSYFVTEDSYRSIATNFNMSESSVYDAVSSAIKVMSELDCINWPEPDAQEVEMATFQQRAGFPGVVGCVDGMHVEVVTRDPVHHYRKKRLSLNVMLTVDSQEKIIHFNVGPPGSYHDARVFQRSGLPAKLENLASDRHILGDNAFPLMKGLMKPYADTGALNVQMAAFNHNLSLTRMVVENAKARVKNKWRRLKKIYSKTITRAERIIITCLKLHNCVLKFDSDLCRSND